MIQHDRENHTFLIKNQEGISWLEYQETDRSVTVLHTVVPPELSGKGLAARLAAAAWDYAQKQHKEICSECSYMTAWLKRRTRS